MGSIFIYKKIRVKDRIFAALTLLRGSVTNMKSQPSLPEKTVFISKDLGKDNLILSGLVSSGYKIFHESLIQISPIRFSYAQKTKWIFFSSKNSIEHFFNQEPVLEKDTKFGVMGKSSADYLSSFGKQADFIGEGVDTNQIGKKFAEIIKNETVLFPQALDSLQTIQKHLSFGNISSNLFVYKTTLKTDLNIPSCEILVFTSPSNVSAYFNKYKFLPGQKAVAMGSSTLRQLNSYGVKKALMPTSFDDKGLLEVILTCVNA